MDMNYKAAYLSYFRTTGWQKLTATFGKRIPNPK